MASPGHQLRSAGHTGWMFDHVDRCEVKRGWADGACFGGNVLGSLLKAGTPQDIADNVLRLIDTGTEYGVYACFTEKLDQVAPIEKLPDPLLLPKAMPCGKVEWQNPRSPRYEEYDRR